MRASLHPPAWVADWIGVPYASDAKPATLEEAKRIGANCWALVGLVLKHQFATPIDDYDGALYHGRRDARAVGEAANAFAARWRIIEAGCEQAGDVVRMRMGGAPIHVGIIVAPGHMLHVEEESESACERYRGFHWKDRIVAFHRAEPA